MFVKENQILARNLQGLQDKEHKTILALLGKIKEAVIYSLGISRCTPLEFPRLV
jgi:hypothetical protein